MGNFYFYEPNVLMIPLNFIGISLGSTSLQFAHKNNPLIIQLFNLIANRIIKQYETCKEKVVLQRDIFTSGEVVSDKYERELTVYINLNFRVVFNI